METRRAPRRSEEIDCPIFLFCFKCSSLRLSNTDEFVNVTEVHRRMITDRTWVYTEIYILTLSRAQVVSEERTFSRLIDISNGLTDVIVNVPRKNENFSLKSLKNDIMCNIENNSAIDLTEQHGDLLKQMLTDVNV